MSNTLEEKAIQNYKNNLTYFEKHQKEVYNKLAALDSAVVQGHYKEKYDLILKEDYFDVLELSTNIYLYAKDSNDYATLAAKSVNYKKDSSLFEAFKNIKVKQENLNLHANEDITDNSLHGFAHILDYIDKHEPKDAELLKIKKFIFFGVGLGTHITQIAKKIDSDVYLIIEDDLELFKLSLFVTPYYKLAQKAQLFFSVFDSNEEFNKPAQKFLATNFYDNHYIKYFHMLSHTEDKEKQFHLKIASQSHNLFFYSSILDQYVKPLKYIHEGYNFLNLLKVDKTSPLHTQKVLFLAAGPSLQKNIEWLKLNHKKFIIVALSSVLNILQDAKIKPDIVTHLDGFESSVKHFTKLKSLDFLKDTTFLLSARVKKELVNMLDKKHVFFFENGTSYKLNLGNLSAYCVGSTTYLLLLALGVKNMYLLGLDLALDAKTGLTHSDKHEFVKKLDTNSIDNDEENIIFKGSLVKTAGNFSQEVLTTPDFLLSINSINTSSTKFKQSFQNVYNLNDGAFFENTISKNINEINSSSFEELNKSKINKQTNSLFTTNSSNKLTEDESKKIKDINIHAKYLRELILKEQSLIFDSSDAFLSSHISLIKKLISKSNGQNGDLALIFQEYLKFIDTFIFDFFNKKGLKNEITHANEINSIVNMQLLRIVDKYLSAIK